MFMSKIKFKYGFLQARFHYGRGYYISDNELEEFQYSKFPVLSCIFSNMLDSLRHFNDPEKNAYSNIDEYIE